MAISAATRFVNVPSFGRSGNVNSIVCTWYVATTKHLNAGATFSTTALRAEEHTDKYFYEGNEAKKKPVFMSSHMRRYLKKAKDHEEFMKKQVAEYEIGLRHLSNIMGEDVETLKKTGTQKHIQYLFPSGLFEKKARPMLVHPNILFPAPKEAEFDYSGRPHHAFFYTTKPRFYKLLHDLTGWCMELDRIEEKAIKNKTVIKPGEKQMNFEELVPVGKEVLENKLCETISDKQYEYFLTNMERLIEHPFSKEASSFITEFYKPKAETTFVIKYKEAEYDENKRPYVKITNCSRKNTRGEVIVYGEGTGKIEINGKDILFFEEQHFREQVSGYNLYVFLYFSVH